MPRGFSVWLDLIRIGAALTVVLGHMAHPRFTRGDYNVLREWTVAPDAVVVFFVISGLVIAYAADRDGNLKTYAFNRLSRIYTVLVPALFLTLAFDAIGAGIRGDGQSVPYDPSQPIGVVLFRGLTLSIEWTGMLDPVRLGTNAALWSLSYEVAYYALFGIALFLSGPLRIVLILIVALIVGLPVLALLPTWLIGILVWRRIRSGAGLPPHQALALAIGAPVMIVLAKLAGLHVFFATATLQAFASLGAIPYLGYSDKLLWNTVLAGFIALHLLGVASLFRTTEINPRSRTVRAIRWAAGGSFSLYVVHFPVLYLLNAVLPKSLPLHDLWLLGLTLAICFGFAALFERPLKTYRALLRRLWPVSPKRVPAGT